MPKATKPRGWWRQEFHDHPRAESKSADCWANAKGDRIKTFCKACFNVQVLREMEKDATEVSSGMRISVRTRQDVEEYLWGPGPQADISTRHWTTARAETMQVHLRDCLYTSPAIKQRAVSELLRAKLRSTREAVTVHESPASNTAHPEATAPIPPLIPSQSPNLIIDPSLIPSGSFISLNSPDDSSRPSSSHASSVRASPSLPDFHAGSTLRTLSTSRRSMSIPRGRSAASTPDSRLQWTPGDQHQFETILARLTASAGLPLRWIENPEFLHFCNVFIPAAKVPSRKVLTKRIIPATVKVYRDGAKAAVSGRDVTFQTDGWTGADDHHLLAFMVNADRKVYAVRVNDTSGERKTADIVFSHIWDMLMHLRNDWNAVIAGFTSDASGESRKARKMLQARDPSIIVLDCFAHQVNLIVGDYFKSSAGFLSYTDKATELISWLRNKPYVLGCLRNIQAATTEKPLSVVRAVLTRWTAHYLAYRRLLELQTPLRMLVDKDNALGPGRSQIVTGDRRSKDKANTMFALIQDAMFWHSLTRMKNHLEPLAIAANITQGANCRLDQVLLTFAGLYNHFARLSLDDEGPIRTAVLSSIERRWKNTDQEVFAMAVFLNPSCQLAPFRKQQWCTLSGLFMILTRLWGRFFLEPVPIDFHSELKDYLHHTNKFTNLPNYVQGIQNSLPQGQSVDPIQIWDGYSHGAQYQSPLTRLATRIFSVCPNSASCERLFSNFGNILTKHRTRLQTDMLMALAELKMFLRDEHEQAQLVKKRLQREYGTGTDTAQAIATPNSASPATPQSGTTTPQLQSELNAGSETEQSSDVEEPTNATNPSLRIVADDLLRLQAHDSDDDATLLNLGHEGFAIADIFDFAGQYWTTATFQDSASLAEEMEMHELLDRDAEGQLDSNDSFSL